MWKICNISWVQSCVVLTSILCMSVIWSSLRNTMAAINSKSVHSIAYVTAPSQDVAKKLARSVVEKKLAACVNIIPQVTSVYSWEDKINEDSEVLMMIKTRTSRVNDLTSFVKSNHPYDVCEVITTPIESGNPEYLNWISSIVPEKQD